MRTYRNRKTDQLIETDSDSALAARLEALPNWERADAQHEADGGGDIDPGDLDAIEAQLAQLSPEQRNAIREVLTRFEDPETQVEEPSGEFDPSEHSVKDVNAYLAEASAEERARVIEVEQAGQGRVGILDGPWATAE